MAAVVFSRRSSSELIVENWDDNWEPEWEPPRDTKIDQAKEAVLQKLFAPNPDEVFYGRQAAVLLEKEYFHWITAKALREIVGKGLLRSEKMRLNESGKVSLNIYRLPKNRYWRRRANRVLKLVRRYSDHKFSRALGRHGEQMFDAALPRVGMQPLARNTRSYQGKTWKETNHDLDRIFELDGIGYGVEIKNTLPYIPRDELDAKLRMCAFLDLTPLFIVRFAPKSYVHEIQQRGGFTLIFKYQLYPYGFEDMAREVKSKLRLPVDCPATIAEGTCQRFLRWHRKRLVGES